MNQFSFKHYDDHKINHIDVSASAWSPKRDLIALGSSTGDIFLYRLQMTLIWKVNIKTEGSVVSICWHPDGNILAVSFTSGLIQYYSMYHHTFLYEIKFKESVNNMQWISVSPEHCLKESTADKTYNTNEIFPHFDNLFQNSLYKEEIKRMEEILGLNSKLSILIGICGFSIFVLARGFFSLGEVTLEDCQTSSNDHLLSVNMTPYVDSMSVTLQTRNVNGESVIRTHVINCSYIRENLNNISSVSSIIINMIHLRLLLQLHMKEIEESWEDCLNDFEAGMVDYSKKREHIPNWSLRTDFMEMVLFGCCNKEFWKTLEKSLPMCWFKQIFDRMTKMSDHIKNHCLPNIHLTLMKLLIHCNELCNIIKYPSECCSLHLSNNDINNVADVCRGTLLKLHEFQTILSDNMDNLKLFFQWISNGIEAHVGETENFHSFSYSDLSTIMEFIINKLHVIKNEKNEIISYKIEILHQYLIGDNLLSPQLNNSKNFLFRFIKQVTEQKEDSLEILEDGFFRINSEKSLSNMANKILPSVVDGVCWNYEKQFLKKYYDRSDGYQMTLATFPSFDYHNIIVISESYVDDNENGVVEVYAVYSTMTQKIIWVQNQVECIKSCLINLDSLNGQPNKFIRISKMQFYNANTIFLLVSVENDSIVENCYLIVLLWSHLQNSHPEKIKLHSINQLRNDFFSIWTAYEETYFKLSESIEPNMLEVIPTDAVDMVISCSRDLALIFFGKSHERCRIFMLNDE